MKNLLKYLALVVLAVGAGPASSAVWQWSKTASVNAGADPTINWAEGMSPSSINDSSRAEMARVAEYRDDISGLLATAGTATAYTVTTNQGLCLSPSLTPQDGQLLSITPNATNGSAVTLTADSCSAFPIQTSPGAAVGAGTLISGSPYSMKFSVANSAWMLRDFYSSAFNVPLGALVAYTGAVSPNSNFILPAGQCISTTTYANYWALMGSPASGSCAGGQFAVLDMRGRVPAALDNLNGTAANRMTAAGCGTAFTTPGVVCPFSAETTVLGIANLPTFSPSGTIANGAISIIGSGTAAVSGLFSDITPGSVQGSAPGTLGATQAPSTFTGTPIGSSTPIVRVQPTIGVTYLLRVI